MGHQHRSNLDTTQPSPGNAGAPRAKPLDKPLDANRRGYGGSVGAISPEPQPKSPAAGENAKPSPRGRQEGTPRSARGDHRDPNEQTLRSESSSANGGYPIGSFDQSGDASSAQRGQSDVGGAQGNESIEAPSDTGMAR